MTATCKGNWCQKWEEEQDSQETKKQRRRVAMRVGIQVQSCEQRRRNMEVGQDLALARCEEHIRRGDDNI